MTSGEEITLTENLDEAIIVRLAPSGVFGWLLAFV